MERTEITLSKICKNIHDRGGKAKVCICGFGSVAQYLFDYLLTMPGNPDIVICTRNTEKASQFVNCLTRASVIRTGDINKVSLRSCNFDNIDELSNILSEEKPDIVVNASRYVSGLKYGSISWNCCRAYGYWLPLSMYYTKKIGEAIIRSGIECAYINTSYPDATNPWFKHATKFNMPIFGAGNINHIVARYKVAFIDLWNQAYPNNKLEVSDIDVAMVASHFHDVLIGKNGTDKDSDSPFEGPEILVNVSLKNEDNQMLEEELKSFAYNFHQEILRNCAIAFPSDKTRNMMVASSAFEIIDTIIYGGSIYKEIKNDNSIYRLLNIPGALGTCGGLPVLVNLSGSCEAMLAKPSLFGVDLPTMLAINRQSLFQDGLDLSLIDKGIVRFVNPKKLNKLESLLDFHWPTVVKYEEVEDLASLIAQYIDVYQETRKS